MNTTSIYGTFNPEDLVREVYSESQTATAYSFLIVKHSKTRGKTGVVLSEDTLSVGIYVVFVVLWPDNFIKKFHGGWLRLVQRA